MPQDSVVSVVETGPTASSFDLKKYGITVDDIRRNLSPAELYTPRPFARIAKCDIADTGALIALLRRKDRPLAQGQADRRASRLRRTMSGGATSTSPSTTRRFEINRERAIDYLNTRKQLYVVDGFAGWDPAQSR